MTEKKGKSGTIDVKALLAGDEEFLRALEAVNPLVDPAPSRTGLKGARCLKLLECRFLAPLWAEHPQLPSKLRFQGRRSKTAQNWRPDTFRG